MGSESLRPQAEDFPSSHVPGDLLVPFASLQKELAAAAAKPLFCFEMFRLRAGYFPEKESNRVIAKSALFGTPRFGYPSRRSLAPPFQP